MKKFNQYINETPGYFLTIATDKVIFIVLLNKDKKILPNQKTVDNNTFLRDRQQKEDILGDPYRIGELFSILKIWKDRDHTVNMPENYQDIILKSFPEIYVYIDNLTPEMKSKHSHIGMSGKFGMFDED